MMADADPIPVRIWSEKDGKFVESYVFAPRIYPRQRQLIHTLIASGVRVYIVSASLEELVRMVACDARYGLNVEPQRVIGVTLMLNDPNTGELTAPDSASPPVHFSTITIRTNITWRCG